MLAIFALAALSPAAQARRAVDDATKSYVEAVGPALEGYSKVGDDVDSAIAKAGKRSDKANASKFGGLVKRIKTARRRLDRIEPPRQFVKPHKAFVSAVSRLAGDVALVAKAAREKDKQTATRAGFRLGRTIKALNKADRALELALRRVAAPGDAASL